jgi:folate-dependent phosphoribosylglycinamide formyltransferase PurN
LSQRDPKEFLKKDPDQAAYVAIFLSGSGTNAEKILDFWLNEGENCSFIPVCLVTDRPLTCRAEEIASKYQLPLVAEDIKEFYQSKGLETTSLASEEGREVRKEWTTALRQKLSIYKIDFGIFAGFIPLTNITDYFPCLNVHPGDLTSHDENGQRTLVGLHTRPIQKAILEGHESLRSSVIIACAYEGGGVGMDNGLVAGVSTEVKIDWMSKSCEEWIGLYKSRSGSKPVGGWKDEFQDLLNCNLSRLKEAGDWVVFPKVVDDFAQGRFCYSENTLFYKGGKSWLPLEVIEYSVSGKEIYLKSSDL